MHFVYFASLLDESCKAFAHILIEEGKKYQKPKNWKSAFRK